MSTLRDNWTRDAQGNLVDWTKPPHKVPRSGVICLVLEGEKAHLIPDDIRIKRKLEYYALIRRDMHSLSTSC